MGKKHSNQNGLPKNSNFEKIKWQIPLSFSYFVKEFKKKKFVIFFSQFLSFWISLNFLSLSLSLSLSKDQLRHLSAFQDTFRFCRRSPPFIGVLENKLTTSHSDLVFPLNPHYIAIQIARKKREDWRNNQEGHQSEKTKKQTTFCKNQILPPHSHHPTSLNLPSLAPFFFTCTLQTPSLHHCLHRMKPPLASSKSSWPPALSFFGSATMEGKTRKTQMWKAKGETLFCPARDSIHGFLG